VRPCRNKGRKERRKEGRKEGKKERKEGRKEGKKKKTQTLYAHMNKRNLKKKRKEKKAAFPSLGAPIDSSENLWLLLKTTQLQFPATKEALLPSFLGMVRSLRRLFTTVGGHVRHGLPSGVVHS
jgi:hypothetical protein